MHHEAEVRGQRGQYRLDLDGPRGGGQATVYPSTGPDGARLAIKIARDRTSSRWIARERDALQALNAQSVETGAWVVPLLDHGVTDDGRVFLVLPWFDDSLGGWVQKTSPPLTRRLEALRQACAAVIRLHRSVDDLTAVRVHRDIKPDNFLVTEEDGVLRVVLADLGGVKEGRLLSVGHHTTLHTPNYAPPEQTLPLEQAPDPAMDVHALAATIFWVLTGAPPASILARQSSFTPAGIRLCQLFGQRPRSPEAEAEYQDLRRRPLGALFALTQAEALTVEDEALLRAALQRMTPQADALADRLLPPLRRALEPDPLKRAGDPRKLMAAVVLALESIDGEVAPVVAPMDAVAPGGTVLVPEPGSDSETILPVSPTVAPKMPPDRLKKTSGGNPAVLLLGLLLLMMLGGASVAGLGVIGLIASQPSEVVEGDEMPDPDLPETVNGKPLTPEEIEEQKHLWDEKLEELERERERRREAWEREQKRREEKGKKGKRKKKKRNDDDDDD